MTPNQELYELVHSLDAAELRNFKKFLNKPNKKEKGGVEILLDLMKKHKSFDEDKIQRAIDRSSLAKRYAYFKHHLINQVVDFLGIHHRNQNVLYQLNSLHTQIQILFYKKQYSLATKLVNRSIELAKKNNWPAATFKLLVLKLQLIDFDAEYDFKNWERTIKEAFYYKEYFSSKSSYYLLFQKLITLESSEKLLDVNNSKALLSDLPEDIHFVNEELARDSLNKKMLYLIKAIYYKAIDQGPLFLDYRMKAFNLYQADPDSILKTVYDQHSYIGRMADVFKAYYILGEIDAAEKMMADFKKFPLDNELDEKILDFHQALVNIYSVELNIYAKKYEKAKLLLDQSNPITLFSTVYESIRIDFYNLQLHVYFFFDKHADFQALFNEHFKDLKKYEVSNFFNKLFYFLSVYECGDYDLLESEFEGLYYIKRKCELNGPYFDQILTLIRRIKQSPLVEDVQKISKQVMADLPIRAIPISHYDQLLRFWLRDKVNGTKMENVVKAVQA